MRLAFDEYGEPGAPLLIVAHGLFGSARNWRALAKRFGPGRRVLAVDLRNHGRSPHDPVHDYPAMAADLAELIEAEGAPAAILGHSMGGKAAMTLALTRPDLVERLIVADIAPIAYQHSLMSQIEAMRAVDLAACARRSEVEAAMEGRIAEAPVRAFLATSADLAATPPRWLLGLDALGANMDLITGFPDLDGRFDGPAAFINGADSDYVTEEGRALASRLFPAAEFTEIPAAGHWLHAEQPRAFLTAVNEALA